MKKIISISDVYEEKNKGIVIAGVNSELDALPLAKVKEWLGDFVFLNKEKMSELRLKVIDVDCSTSIANKKNIFILISYDGDIDNIKSYIQGDASTEYQFDNP